MKIKIIFTTLSILLITSLLGNFLLYGVLNDEINSQRILIGCLLELENQVKDETTISQVESHVKDCILNNTTLINN